MVEVHKRNRLPHWRSSATYFLTFNLFDAIPVARIEQFRAERNIRVMELERLRVRATAAEIAVIDRIIHERSEECLDQHLGSCFMRDVRIASLVANALLFFDGERYEICAWCVMPKHVHVVFDALVNLDSIVQSWKSYTSKEANRLLNRKGKFWHDDYFDRSIRSREEFDRTIQYVLNNPINAGLMDWPWVGRRDSGTQAPAATVRQR